MLLDVKGEVEKLERALDEGKRIIHVIGNSYIDKSKILKELSNKKFKEYIQIGSSYQLKSFPSDKAYISSEEDFIFLIEFYDFLIKNRILLESEIKITKELQQFLIENYKVFIFDEAQSYGELACEIIYRIANSPHDNTIIIATNEKNLENSKIAEVIEKLRSSDKFCEIKLGVPDRNKVVEIIERELINKNIPKELILECYEKAEGDMNFTIFLLSGYLIGETNPLQRFTSLTEFQTEILGLVSIAYTHLSLIDLLNLTDKNLEKISEVIDFLRANHWLIEIDGVLKPSSQKIKELVIESLPTATLIELHKKLAKKYELDKNYVAAGYHCENFDHKSAATHYRKASELAIKTHSYYTALILLKRAWELNGSTDDLYMMAKIMLEIGDIDTMESIASQYPNDPRMLYLLSITNILKGNPTEALKLASSSERYLDDNLRISSKIVQALSLRYLGLQNISNDIAELVLNISEKYDHLEGKIYSMFILGTNAMETDVDKAMAYLEKAFRLSDRLSLQYVIGIYYIKILCQKGMYNVAEEAIELLKSNVKRSFSTTYERYAIKLCELILYFYKKDWNNFLNLANRLFDFLDPSELRIYKVYLLLMLGEYYKDIGEYENSKRMFEEAFNVSKYTANAHLIKMCYKYIKSYEKL